MSQSLTIAENAERALVYPRPGNNSSLENLPVEIRLHMLSFMDLEELKSLVLVSEVPSIMGSTFYPAGISSQNPFDFACLTGDARVAY